MTTTIHYDVDADGRECSRGARCARSWIDTDGERRGDWGPRIICDADRAHLERVLAELPELYVWLWMQLPATQTTAAATGGASHPAHAPLPIRGDVDELLRQVHEVTGSWETRVRTVARLPVHRAGAHPGGAALTTTVRLLLSHLDALVNLPEEPMVRTLSLADAARLPDGSRVGIADPATGMARVVWEMDGAAAVEELHDLHRRCRSRAGMTRRTTPLRGVPCPHCDLVALVRTTGDDNPWCQGCGQPLTEDEYTRWVKLQAGWVG